MQTKFSINWWSWGLVLVLVPNVSRSPFCKFLHIFKIPTISKINASLLPKGIHKTELLFFSNFRLIIMWEYWIEYGMVKWNFRFAGSLIFLMTRLIYFSFLKFLVIFDDFRRALAHSLQVLIKIYHRFESPTKSVTKQTAHENFPNKI